MAEWPNATVCKTVSPQVRILFGTRNIILGSNPAKPTKNGLIVQWIERGFPKPQIQVRFLVGLPPQRLVVELVDTQR